MAGIDKMCMTREELYLFYEWLFNHFNINDAGKEIIENFKPLDDGRTENKIYAVFNFSNETDAYLMEHCKLKHVQKRLKEQYG
jgi:hypothetical protein